MAISPGSLLLVNSFSVAPLAEATTGGFRLRGNSQAIDTAVEEAGQLNADRQRQEAEKPLRSPSLVAFDAKGTVRRDGAACRKRAGRFRIG